MKSKFGILILAIVVISGALFQSCKKEKTEVNMIIKNWTLLSKTALGVDIATDCEKSEKWNFKVDNAYTITDTCGNTKTGTWMLADDGKTLTLDNVTAYSVVENSLLKLVIELQVNEYGLVRWTFL